MLLALATAFITISPPVHPVCEHVAQQLMQAIDAGFLTPNEAITTFESCMIVYPPMSPDITVLNDIQPRYRQSFIP